MTAQPAEQIEDETPIETPDEQEAGQQQADAAEVRARRMGWRPKEEYKGDPDKWVDAESFIKQAEEDAPRIRDANRHMERKIEKLEKGIEEILAHQERQLDRTRKEAYERAMADLRAQHEKAVEDGDVIRANKAATSMTDLAKAQVAEANAPQAGTKSNDEQIVNDWKAENPWYDEHPDLRNTAAAKENQLAAQGIPLAQRLKMTAEYMRKWFPDRVDGGSTMHGGHRDTPPSMPNASRRNGHIRDVKPKPGTYEALKPEARQQCDRVVRASGGKITRESWLENAKPIPELWQ